MPEVVEVKPKGIYIKIEYSLEELIHLKKALEHVDIKVDLNNDDEKKFHDYFVKTFYPFIAELVEDLKNGPGSNS